MVGNTIDRDGVRRRSEGGHRLLGSAVCQLGAFILGTRQKCPECGCERKTLIRCLIRLHQISARLRNFGSPQVNFMLHI